MGGGGGIGGAIGSFGNSVANNFRGAADPLNKAIGADTSNGHKGDPDWVARGKSGLISYINSTQYLTAEQKADYLAGIEKDWAQGRESQKQSLKNYNEKLAALPQIVEDRKTYVQEQYNVMQNQTNAKLQQNRIASFLGATAVRGFLG